MHHLIVTEYHVNTYKNTVFHTIYFIIRYNLIEYSEIKKLEKFEYYCRLLNTKVLSNVLEHFFFIIKSESICIIIYKE